MESPAFRSKGGDISNCKEGEFVAYRSEAGVARITLNRPRVCKAKELLYESRLIDDREAEKDPDYALVVPEGARRPMVQRAFENYERQQQLCSGESSRRNDDDNR